MQQKIRTFSSPIQTRLFAVTTRTYTCSKWCSIATCREFRASAAYGRGHHQSSDIAFVFRVDFANNLPGPASTGIICRRLKFYKRIQIQNEDRGMYSIPRKWAQEKLYSRKVSGLFSCMILELCNDRWTVPFEVIPRSLHFADTFPSFKLMRRISTLCDRELCTTIARANKERSNNPRHGPGSNHHRMAGGRLEIF